MSETPPPPEYSVTLNGFEMGIIASLLCKRYEGRSMPLVIKNIIDKLEWAIKSTDTAKIIHEDWSADTRIMTQYHRESE